MDKYYYGYDEFLRDVKTLHRMVEAFAPDTLLPIARGGLTLGHFLGTALDIRRVFALNTIHYEGSRKLDTLKVFNIPDLSDTRRVLILDDISDSGETLVEVLRLLRERHPDIEFKVATLFFKSSSMVQPDFTIHEAPSWIHFFWDVDPLEQP